MAQGQSPADADERARGRSGPFNGWEDVITATLTYRQVNSGKAVGKRALIDTLTKTFGHMPSQLGGPDISALEIAERFVFDDDLKKEVRELIDAVEKLGEIALEVEY